MIHKFLNKLKTTIEDVIRDDQGALGQETVIQANVTDTASISQRIQWPRRFFHMGGGFLTLAIYMTGFSTDIALLICLPLLLTLVVSDLIRLHHNRFNKWFLGKFGALMRSHEAHTLHSGSLFFLTVYACLLIFDKPILVPALMMLAFGDPAAAVVGITWGKIKIFGKSLEGTMACFQVCFIIGLIFFPARPLVAFGTAIVAALAELLPMPIDDNITIPAFACLALFLLL